MKLERKKNTIRNIIWGVISRVIALLGPFLVRTIIIYILGTEYLGLSSLFTSILQVLNMVELGFSSAIAFSMYAPIANNDETLICALLGYFKKIYKIVGAIVLCLGLLLLPFLKFLIKGDVPDDINIYYLYLLYLINTCVSYLLFGYKTVLFSAFQREDVLNKVYTFLQLIQYVLQIVVLLVFKDYYIYYVIVPVISVLNNITIERLTKKVYPNFIPKGKVPHEIKKDVKEKVSGVVISKFCGLTRNTFDSIIISTFLGLTTVAIYSNYYYLLSNVSSVIVIFVTSMRAGIGNSVATESKEKNYQDYNKFTFMYSWISSWCAICLLCLYQPFMKLWVGENNMFPFYIVVLLCIYFIGLSMSDITNAYSGAVGLWWENRYRTLFEALSNLGLNIVMGYFLGVFGIVLATVLTIISFNFIWQTKILFKCYFQQFSFTKYVLNQLKYLLVTSIVALLTFGICNIISVGLVGDLMFRGIVCVIIPNILFFVFYRSNRQFMLSKDFIIQILKRKGLF